MALRPQATAEAGAMALRPRATAEAAVMALFVTGSMADSLAICRVIDLTVATAIVATVACSPCGRPGLLRAM